MEITPVTEIELPAQTLLDHTNVRAKMVMMEMEKHALRKVSRDYCLTAGKKSINAKKITLLFHGYICVEMDLRAGGKLARFPVSDPWVLNFVSICHAVIGSLSYVFMPQEVYSDLRFLFLPPPLRGQKSTSAALLGRRGNYFRPYLSITRVCHRGAA